MVAGEASSDQLAAHLIGALSSKHLPDAAVLRHRRAEDAARRVRVTLAGRDARRAGLCRSPAQLSGDYPHATPAAAALAGRTRPDAFIGVDGYGFQPVAGTAAQACMEFPRSTFVSPSIWAWRRHRMAKIVGSVSHILALFPFEPELYK
jgi:lipid-A-disaccharide synthase